MEARLDPADAGAASLDSDTADGTAADPVARDARSFGAFSAAGGWTFALMVARSVRKGERRGSDTAGEPGAVPGKVSLKAFAEQAGCDAARVSRYWRAWERAADEGVVPPAGRLSPGQDVPLPEPDTWASYFMVYEATTDRHAGLAAEAESIGTSFNKAVDIASNRPAMRAAILGDPQTAAAAREALLGRPQERTAIIAQALTDPDTRRQAAAESRRVERAAYVERVLSEGKAKTPGGQMIDLDPAEGADVVARLATVRDPEATVEEVNEAYEYVQDLIAGAVDADPDVLVHEQRTRIGKVVTSTVKNLQTIDPDDLLAFADDSVITGLSELQRQVNTLATLVLKQT
ncbi:hypothetical protein [Spirillospora sp. NPDC047279]|uniref:hypothetical protein n=1 Tax=Spirillospora sp. NPDC047279 TaxID=3155478 RepID=UPI0033F5ECBE